MPRSPLPWVRSHPFGAALIGLAIWIIDWIVRPFVSLNVERWLEARGFDRFLAEEPSNQWLVALHNLFLGLLSDVGPFALGFACCALLFGLQDMRAKKPLHFKTPLKGKAQTLVRRSNGGATDHETLSGFARSERSDFDLVPVALEIRGRKSEDGCDIDAVLRYRNRSNAYLDMTAIAANFSIGDFSPAGKASMGTSSGLSPERTDGIRFNPIRLYDRRTLNGHVSFTTKFRRSYKKWNVLRARYDFKIMSWPETEKNTEEIEAKAVQTIEYLTEV